MSRDVPPHRQDDLRRRLARYAETWRDDEFLDAMCDWAESGRRFTPAQADAIDESLSWWQRRMTGPSYDPDRPPPGYDQEVWELATWFRQRMDDEELPCASRREIYAELARVIDRDRLRDNHDPWRDKDGKPGWYRMLHAVITAWTSSWIDPDRTMRAHRDLAQPGTVQAVATAVIEDLILDRFAEHAVPCEPYTPTVARRGAVRRYLEGR